MSTTTVRRITAAAVVLVGAAGTAAVLGAGTASATPADHLCSAGEVTTTLVAGDPGAGQRYAYVQFTAQPDQGCSLQGSPAVSLTGAPGVAIGHATGSAPLVTIANGQSAHELLHWTGVEGPQEQVTPGSVTITLPGGQEHRATTVTLPWNQGPLDDSAQAHSLTAGIVAPGAAPIA
jgi:hypothetical protein